MSDPSQDPRRPPGPALEGQAAIDGSAWSAPRQWRTVGIAAAAIASLVAVMWFGGRVFAKPEVAAAPVPSPPGTFRATPQQLKTLTVETVAEHGFVDEDRTEGKIAVNADRATQVFSPFSGRVTRVIASLGEAVKKGSPLALVEASEFVQGQSDLATAVSQVKLSRINEARKHALFDAKGGSLQDWQQAQTDLTSAETALGATRNRLKILGKSDSEIAALEGAKAIDPVARLVAPIAGIVVDRQVGPGQFLQTGSATPVFTIADPTTVWLLANVRESEAGVVKPGQSMEVHVLAYPQRVFTAHVTYVAAILDANTHRIPVRAEIDNRDGALKPEMFANFRILTGDAAQSPAVPQAAVVYEGDVAHVWVIAGESLLAYRLVRTGRSNDGLVEVLEGLKAGDQVVTKGSLFIDQAAVPASS